MAGHLRGVIVVARFVLVGVAAFRLALFTRGGEGGGVRCTAYLPRR